MVSLRERWAVERAMRRIPVILPDGSGVSLSPGGQNVLIREIINGFCARFTPGGCVIYIGDADEKWAVYGVVCRLADPPHSLQWRPIPGPLLMAMPCEVAAPNGEANGDAGGAGRGGT